jgi:DNA repair exonuclease SbcCD nuclease subunit
MPTHTPFRFLLASDLHLERPLHGLAEVPEHLREALLEAPFRAAERIFDAALAEQADFVVLAGDVINAEITGPRGPLFLAKQFQRLREREIAVFWAGGSADPPRSWPDWATLPDNVHRFASSGADEIVCRRQGWPLARLLGTSRDRGQTIPWHDFHGDPTGLFALAAIYAPEVVSVPSTNGIDFWGLGGRHDAVTLLGERRSAEFPGSPQGRSPREPGPHGCTLIDVDEQGRIERRQLATDVVRFWREEVHVTEPGLDATLGLCRQQMEKLLNDPHDGLHLVTWRLHADAGRRHSRRAACEAELLDRLRTEFGYRSPPAWSVAVEIEPARELPRQWYQADTFFGDFLRTVQDCTERSEALPLASYLGVQTDDALHTLAQISDREQLLMDIAQLGADLLAADLPNP